LKQFLNTQERTGRSAMAAVLLAAAMTVNPAAAQTQGTSVFGALGNFDVYNDTGEDAHGFQIELDGLTLQQVAGTFGGTRYGPATVVPFPGGVYVRYQSSWDPAAQQYSATTTVPAAFTPTLGHSCVFSNIAGCDHYGISYYGTPTNLVMQWLVADPANPGSLIPFAGAQVSIPMPVVTVLPPAQPAAAPVIAFEIRIPEPPPVQQFGAARWVKVYKTELPREVALGELLGDNPIVPNDPSLTETAWKLLQTNTRSANSGVLHSQGGLNSGSHSVIRRYEFYKYSGTLDPATHEALCADPTCSAPAANELGDYIGDQMAAANVGIPSVTVSKIGNGTVLAAAVKINCGGACTANVAAGTSVTLTANPGGSLFSGWGGACNGVDLNCSLTVNDSLNITATFTAIHTLSIGHAGNGTVTGNPGGLQSTQINCGGACSAKFAEGTVVTLAAAPSAGAKFTSWSGACSGTSPTCSVTISKDTQVQANFK
jgi:Divergent InlB B-repeat domain